MKLYELLNQETNQPEKPDPALEAKKRQLVSLKRQLEAANRQMENFSKNGKENPSLQKRIDGIKDKMRRIKETMIDELEVKDTK